jgi:hypothetical protein
MVPIVIYFGFINVYAINIPYVDDHGLKGFIVKFFTGNNFIDKINAIFAQHNEHRIALTRFILLIVYFVKNVIDYKWLIWIGNFFLVAIIYQYHQYFKFKSIESKYLLPLPWLLFSFLQNENTYWGMASIQNFGIIFLSLSAFLALEKQKNLWTILYISLAVFTSGNGFIALGLIIGIVILKGNIKQIAIYIATSLLLGFLYFYSYQNPPATPTPNLSDWKLLFKSFFVFIGSFADMSLESEVSSRILKAIVFGLFLFGITILFYLRNLPFNFQSKKIVIAKNYPIFILCTFSLILLTSILVSWSRVAGYGMITILTSRYKIYSITLVITIYVLLLTILEKKHHLKLLIIVLPISVLTFFYSIWQNMSSIDFHYKSLITNAYNWDNEIEKKIKKPNNQYNYQNPNTILKAISPNIFSKITSNAKSYKFEEIIDNKEEFIVRGNGGFAFLLPNDGYFLSLKSDQKVYIFPSHPKKESVRNLIKSQKVFSPRFEIHVAKNELDNGIYTLGFISIENNIIKTFKTLNSVKISNIQKGSIKTNW